jgi:hypothetical protein
MKNILRLVAVAILLLSQAAYAKEVAVLLPVSGPLTPYEKTELTKEAVDVLSARFELKHGEEIDLVVKQAFLEESKKNDCDETNCYRHIAAQYHAEKIVALRVAQVAKGSYLVTAHLYDVLTDRMTFSEKRKCEDCSTQKFKALTKELMSRLAKVN